MNYIICSKSGQKVNALVYINFDILPPVLARLYKNIGNANYTFLNPCIKPDADNDILFNFIGLIWFPCMWQPVCDWKCPPNMHQMPMVTTRNKVKQEYDHCTLALATCHFRWFSALISSSIDTFLIESTPPSWWSFVQLNCNICINDFAICK